MSRCSAAAGSCVRQSAWSTGSKPRASVVFAGRMPYGESLQRLAAADALVQTSIGFETQGMTPVRGRVARDAVDRERPRHRRRAGRRALAGARCLGRGARRDAATGGRRHRSRYAAAGRPVGRRAVPPVLADRGDGRGLSASAGRSEPEARCRGRSRGGCPTRRRPATSSGLPAWSRGWTCRESATSRSGRDGSRPCARAAIVEAIARIESAARRITMNMAVTLRLCHICQQWQNGHRP